MRLRLALLLLAFSALPLPAAEPAVGPAVDPLWGQEPVETSGPTRSTICLNGRWRFLPDRAAGQAPPAGTWGWIRVPGAWSARPRMPGVEAAGSGAAWQGMDGAAWQDLACGWYERDLAIPAAWAGRALGLDLRRVGTDASVLIDGRPAGRIASPEGVLDLTPLVRAGAVHRLTIRVAATVSGAVSVAMGAAADQVFTRTATLAARGLIGDVLLTSRPAGARLEDVQVRTSVRRGRVDLDLELAEWPDGELAVEARMLDPAGREERRFTGACQVAGGRASLGWAWPDARRWDLGDPQLYRLALSVAGRPGRDGLEVGFGFKELWIAGRELRLNGSPVHLRPFSFINENDQNWGMAELVDGAIAGIRAAGFDCQELWPWDQSLRGTPSWHDLWAERAAAAGFGLIMPLVDTRQWLGERWRDPAARAAWEALTRERMRRWRNNPAVLMWVHSPNSFGLWNDQDPRVIGDQAALDASLRADGQEAWAQQGREATDFIRSLDATRPVVVHQGGALGDIQATNTYPCLAQPQEQAEWLSRWALHGDKPFWAVEYGPFVLDYRRGRLTGGWGQDFGAIHTELLASEHLAAWYGEAAYAAETPAMRTANPRHHREKQVYRRIPDAWLSPLAERHMAEQLRDALRSWRGLGAAFAPLPWEAELGWDHQTAADGMPLAGAASVAPPFAPGRRGLWFPTLPHERLHWLAPRGSSLRARGAAITEVNGPSLAWIAAPAATGDAAAFTAKDHAWYGGERLEKTALLLNDARRPLRWAGTWRVLLAGRVLAEGAIALDQATGGRAELPIAADLPAVDARSDGVIELEVADGARQHRDRFPFRVHPRPPADLPAVRLIDPAGDSAALLDRLGVARRDDADAPLVIGRNALAQGAATLADLEAWIRAGGRALVLAQDPEWQRSGPGLRVGRQALRRVFARDPRHPALAGLDELDLRDWRGAGSLIDPYPEVGSEQRAATGLPLHGWRWGNRGSVASAAVEVPHQGGWRPILVADFDLASSPLMELEHGRGRLIWCGLDLEARGAAEPAADRLLASLLRYLATAPVPERGTPVRYLGGAADRALLAGLGVACADLPPGRGLLVAGAGADPAQVAAHAAAGGRVLALDGAAVGVATAVVDEPPPAAEPPGWDWCRGLGRSDLRLRHPGPQALVRGEPPGWTLAAGGLLAERRDAGGAIALCLVDPRRLDADRQTYHRLTRWRQTRVLAQVLADLGVPLAADDLLWSQLPAAPAAIPLAGPWAARFIAPLPPAATPEQAVADGGLSAEAGAAVRPGFDDRAWERRALPASWQGWGSPWADHDGEAVFRRTVEVPAAVAGLPMRLDLGPIDDTDMVFVNGIEVGRTGRDTPQFWQVARSYCIPPGVVRAGSNLIAIRVFDHYAGGRVGVAARGFVLRPLSAPTAGWYHPDYDASEAVGDDPHRYYRW